MAAEITAQNKKEKLERKLKFDTKGCCFLCLTVIDFQTEVKAESDKTGDGNGETAAFKSKEHSSVSLRILNRYLNINLENLFSSKITSSDDNKASSSSSSSKQTEEVKVDLCETCGSMLDKFSKLFLSWEKIQLEIDYWQRRIHQQISNASKIPELVQNYSKRMTNDPETLTQLVFVDNLRKEVSKMSLETSKRLAKVNVKLQRLRKSQMYPAKVRQTSTSGTPVSVMSLAAKEGVQIDHRLLKFENQEEEYDEEANLDQTPPNSPPPSSPPTLSESCTSKKKCIMDGKAIKFQIKSASNSRAKKYVCTKCKKEFTSSHAARAHYDAIHLQRKWKCDICNNSTFAYPQDLRRHKKTCRDTVHQRLSAFKAKQSDPRYLFPCSTCGKRFKTRAKMVGHNRTVHLKEKNHACDLCDKTFLYSSHLKVHKNAVHFGITLECRACSKQFKYNRWLKDHEGKCGNRSGVC